VRARGEHVALNIGRGRIGHLLAIGRYKRRTHFVDSAGIAALAVFLASNLGRLISGQMIPIDGDSQSAS